jgi:hypothetical protein
VRTARYKGLHSIKGLARQLGRDTELNEAVAGQAGRYYKPFDRRPGPGAKWRHIDRPCGRLLDLQQRIHRRILREIELPSQIASVAGHSLTESIKRHSGKRVVAVLDLCDCYPRIDDIAVFEAWTKLLGFGHEAASLLTKLTTFQHRLPQGAPTSPMLANLVLLPMYEQIANLAKERALEVSFYVDDITISGHSADEVLNDIVNIIHASGRRVSREKIRVMRRHAGAQKVLGAVVNRRELSAGSRRIHSIREEILLLGHQADIADLEIKRVRGRIAHVRGLNRPQAEALQRLADRWLPEVGAAGARPRSDEVRPCTRTRRHRRRGH